MRNLAITAVLTGAIVSLATSVAVAQRPVANTYLTSMGPAPTVSPYLNLGVNEFGLSNYPSLVRPLLNEREAQARQAMALERARLQSRGRDGRAAGGTGNVSSEQVERRSSSPFMRYSHYYGGTR
jgi:hypothetical protein